MEQTELLWQYQQADMVADAYENELKRNPKRAALAKKIDFLHEQQNAIKQMEKDIADKTDRVEMLTMAVERLKEQLAGFEGREAPDNLEKAREERAELQQTKKILEDYASELGRIIKAAREHEQNELEIRSRFAKVKAEYDAEKAVYDQERKEQAAILEEKRNAAAEAAKKVDPALLEKYAQIKKHCIPPVARLIGDQCSGCNMILPQATLRKFKADAQFIECENCGRLIIQ